MVSEYINNQCKYRIDKLDNIVYLVNEQALRNIKIDDGEAYVENISQEPIHFHCYNISLEDTDELDERYKFTHTLKFSVNGYVNYHDFEGRYYAIVRSVDNEYWLVNPMFPCKVTYTYTLGHNDSHTDFTLSTISNHPTLRIHGMNQSRPYPCNDYNLDGIDRLFLNEKKYSARSGNIINYTNSGFSEVIYDKKSATFTEQFDGTNVSHSIQFNIKFDDYKDSWHYNLLEFTDNLYAAVITTTKNEYVLCGFHFGLQPSYTVTSNGESTPDYIQINLVDMHDNGQFLTFITGGTISPITETEYKYTMKYNGWECVGNNTARYLLKEEVDVLGNPSGNYMCLEGYEEQFAFLGDQLVGTFDETEEFANSACHMEGCKLYTSLTSPVKMFAQQCKSFSVRADSDWSITNNASYLQISPTSGSANTEYSVSLCNNRPQSASTVITSFTINYCSTSSETFSVQIGKGSGCFYGGDEFNISADAQYVTVPIECCVSAVSETTSALTNIQIFDNYIKIYVPQNTEGSGKTFTLDVTLCDESGEIVTINQTYGYERWVTEGYTCIGKLKCEVQRKYTGTTSGDINTWTEVVRTTNCVQSADCGGSMTRWVETEETVCYMGRKYIVEAEQVKPSTSSDWINTGNQRRGAETVDSPAECSGTTMNKWEVDTSGYTCDGTTKYELMRLYISNDSGATWEATEITKKGVVLEYDSEDCGYVPPSGETIYEWRVEGTDCDGFDLYYWEQKYVSDDGGNTWSPTGTYRYGDLIEQNSSQCGYVPPIVYEYRWILTDETQCGEGYQAVKVRRYYTNNGLRTIYCNSSTTLTSSETRPIESGYSPTAMTSVVIGDCVTEIGGWAFQHCSSLTSVTIPDSVTVIGASAFDDCSSLSHLNLPSGITSIQNETFYKCSGLTSMSIPSSVTSIGGGAFSKCHSLTSIGGTGSGASLIIPNSVTSIGQSAFQQSSGLTSVNIPSGVTYIDQMAFYYCSSLTSITIPSGVTFIGGYCFYGCTALTSATILASTPPEIGYAFDEYNMIFNNTNNCPIYVPAASVNAYKTASGWSTYASRIQAITS